MKLPRLTVRSLMIAVAIVAILAGGKMEGDRRSVRFRRLWAEHSLVMEPNIDKVKESLALRPGDRSDWAVEARKAVARTEYHGKLVVKYDLAARYPWLPVWPDPPEPK